MKQKVLIPLLIMLCLHNAFSQSNIDLNFTPQLTNTSVGSTITISLDATDLANLLAMQVNIEWDSNALELQQPLTNINPLFFNPDLQTNLINAGLLATQWLQPTNTQLLTGSLYDLNFTVLQEGTTSVYIQNSGTSPIFATNAGQISVTTDTATVIITPNTGAINLACSSDINIVAPLGTNSAVVNWSSPTASTTCPTNSDVTLTQTTGQASGSSFGLGQHTIAYSASDNCGNTESCSFTITVTEETNSGTITLLCPKSNSITTLPGQTDTVVLWQTPTSITTCPISSDVAVTQTAGLPIGSSFPIGTHIITYTATDSCGNTATCSFNITITEGIDPGEFSLVCPDNITVNIPANQSAVQVSWNQPTTLSSCSISPNVTLTQTSGATSGSLFSQGNHTITYSASDSCGNSSTCSFNVNVTETSTSSCPSTINGFTKLGEFQGHGYYLSTQSSTWQTAQNLATTNSGYLASITSQVENNYLQTEVTEMAFIGLSDELAEGDLVWESGENLSFTNYATCSWCGANTSANDYGVFLPWDGSWSFDNIWVQRKFILERVCGSNPTTELTLNCPSNINLTLEPNQTSAPVTWSAPTATTTCTDNNITITQTTGQASGASFPQGTHTISYMATDPCGNTQTCSFTITITSGTTSGCPSSIAGFTKIGDLNNHAYFISESEMTWAQAHNVAASANGYIASISTQAENDFLQNNLSEMAFIGINDAQNEGSLIWDNNDPVTYTNYSNCSWCGVNNDANDFGVILPWDGSWGFDNQWVIRKFVLELNCGATNNGSLTLFCQSDDVTLTIPMGQTQVTYTWSDAIPFSSCPSNAQVNVIQTSGPTSGSPLSAGTYTITYEGTDECGNSASCSFTITVIGASSGCGSIAGYTLLAQNNGHGYYLSDNTKTWAAANTASQQQGGYLAAIGSQMENDFLKNHLNNNMVFIGYNDANLEGNGAWSNGEPVSIDLSYNNSSENDYAVMNFWAGTWDMYNQWVAKRYVMEKVCGSSQPISIRPNTHATKALLSPNPAANRITIQMNASKEQEAQIIIFTPSGQEMFTSKQLLYQGFNEFKILLSDLTKGVYFVKIIGVDTHEVLKFIKE